MTPAQLHMLAKAHQAWHSEGNPDSSEGGLSAFAKLGGGAR